jgi:glycosyltransferase involved in cell wall biosynthesis
MRITIVGPAYPLRGGIAHHTYWLHRELVARGHSVQVISFRKLYPRLLFPGTTEIDTSRAKLDPGAEPLLAPLNPIAWLRALRAIRAFAPDVVVFQWWQPFFGLLVGTLGRALRRSGVKQVIECHNIYPHESNPLDRSLLKFAFSSADYFITHSKRDRDDLSSLRPAKPITVCSLPRIDEFAGEDAGSRNGRTILFFGKVRKYKGLAVLLEAMPRVVAKIDCRLLIVGEFYDSIDNYRDLIRAFELENLVAIDNRYVENEEVPGIFAKADVLVLPYVTASQSAVAQIALSNGLPVIASDAGGLSEAVLDNVNGLIFPSGDSVALADRILLYFSQGLGPVFSEQLRVSNKARTTAVDVIEALSASGSNVSERLNARAGT